MEYRISVTQDTVFGIDFHNNFGWRYSEPWKKRNPGIVIAELLARVIAAIRITSIRWRSHLPSPQKTQNLVLIDLAFVAVIIGELNKDWEIITNNH